MGSDKETRWPAISPTHGAMCNTLRTGFGAEIFMGVGKPGKGPLPALAGVATGCGALRRGALSERGASRMAASDGEAFPAIAALSAHTRSEAQDASHASP